MKKQGWSNFSLVFLHCKAVIYTNVFSEKLYAYELKT